MKFVSMKNSLNAGGPGRKGENAGIYAQLLIPVDESLLRDLPEHTCTALVRKATPRISAKIRRDSGKAHAAPSPSRVFPGNRFAGISA